MTRSSLFFLYSSFAKGKNEAKLQRISVFVESIIVEKVAEDVSVVVLLTVVVFLVANAAFLLTTAADFASFTAKHRALHVATRHAATDQTHFQSAVDVARPTGGSVRGEEQQTNQHPRPSGHHRVAFEERVARGVDALFDSVRCSFRHFISVLFSFRISSERDKRLPFVLEKD